MDSGHEHGFQLQRIRMVEDQLRSRGIRDQRVLEAMLRVPRHVFINTHNYAAAYGDYPIAVGYGATISQPFMVATMLENLRVASDCRVLEVGTGTGYQAALLGELAAHVVSIERVPALAAAARENLFRLDYKNVEVAIGDGSVGYLQGAPYDRIIVAAAAPEIPEALVAQLSPRGILLIPVGVGDTQILQRIERIGDGRRVESLDACRFVRLIGEQGHKPEEI